MQKPWSQIFRIFRIHSMKSFAMNKRTDDLYLGLNTKLLFSSGEFRIC